MLGWPYLAFRVTIIKKVACFIKEKTWLAFPSPCWSPKLLKEVWPRRHCRNTRTGCCKWQSNFDKQSQLYKGCHSCRGRWLCSQISFSWQLKRLTPCLLLEKWNWWSCLRDDVYRLSREFSYRIFLWERLLQYIQLWNLIRWGMIFVQRMGPCSWCGVSHLMQIS